MVKRDRPYGPLTPRLAKPPRTTFSNRMAARAPQKTEQIIVIGAKTVALRRSRYSRSTSKSQSRVGSDRLNSLITTLAARNSFHGSCQCGPSRTTPIAPIPRHVHVAGGRLRSGELLEVRPVHSRFSRRSARTTACRQMPAIASATAPAHRSSARSPERCLRPPESMSGSHRSSITHDLRARRAGPLAKRAESVQRLARRLRAGG